jgi:putative DNA primase/helicase
MTDAPASPVLAAALALVGAGWPVFPCSPDTKGPLIDGGFKSASANPQTVAGWWTRSPRAMIGLPTGKPIGAFVVDIDPGPDETAEGVLGRLIEALGCPLPPAPTVRTPRGGMHLYFAMPPEVVVGNRARLVPGVDVRGDGGYVIVPPSVRSGARAREEGCEGAPTASSPAPVSMGSARRRRPRPWCA